MSSRVTRDHHSLSRNLKLNGKYISNDGGDEGISISDSGTVSMPQGMILGTNSGSADVFITAAYATDKTVLKAYYNNVLIPSTSSGGIDWYWESQIYMKGAASPPLIIHQTNNNYTGGKLRLSGQENGYNGQINGKLEFAKSKAEDEIAAYIYSRTDASDGVVGSDHGGAGTNNDGDWPSNLVFSTTANGATTPTDRMTIGSDGVVTIVNDLSLTDGTSQIFDFDTANCHLRIFDDADTDGDRDYFDISVGAAGATSITTNDDGGASAHLTFDPNGKTIFKIDDGNADDIQILRDSTISHSFYSEQGAQNIFRIYEPDSNNDHFNIDVREHGATKLYTYDTSGAGADLTLDPDGDVIIEPVAITTIKVEDGAQDSFRIVCGGTITHGTYSESGGVNNFRIYEPDSTNDFCQIAVEQHGATTILTRDTNAAVAHLTIDPDGELNLTPATEVKSDAPLKIKEAANAVADTAAYGQLWVKTATPNQLYFTTDAGDDIQITSGTSIAGGGGGASALNDLSDVTYSSGDLTITSLDTIISGALTLDSSGDITFDSANGIFHLFDDGDSNDAFKITVIGGTGNTTLETVSEAADGFLTLKPDASAVIIDSADLQLYPTQKLYFDSGGDTYINESSADVLSFTVGGDSIMTLNEATTNGNRVDFGTTGVGWTQFEPTYNASDTNVYFNRYGNKAFATFGTGNITDLNLFFPNVSCNCVLLLKQDGTGGRTVTYYKTFDQSQGNESTVVWAGGSNPTLTTAGNKIDILSFYWDNDNHKAYGVATLNF